MEDYDDEPDLNEQTFHNNVREQIVSKHPTEFNVHVSQRPIVYVVWRVLTTFKLTCYLNNTKVIVHSSCCL